jgi:SAM-dependent methyltransferase
MNLIHRWLCRSDYWKKTVETQLLPWALEGVELGSNVLEIGPGPGITTDLLRTRVARLTCVEIDRALADSLGRRLAGQNVRVLCEDATAMPFAGETFDGVVSFTMLHHVPSAALQDRVLAEVARVLRPGGIFAGIDSLNRRFFSALHLFDTLVLVDPRTFPSRLEAAGFADTRVDVGPRSFRFRARRPN